MCARTDEVGQGKRAHWLVGAQLHAHVDVFRRRDALHQRKEGLVNHRHQDAVHHEALRGSTAAASHPTNTQ